MSARNRLILDTDGGIDDAQALLMLIAGGRTPDAVTTVFGNVELEVATRNMLATLSVAGVDVPVHMGAEVPMAQPIIDAKHVHGEDGLGGAQLPEITAEPASQDAIGFLRQTFRDAAEAGEKTDILMIGPLTNLAHALTLEPGILSGIGQLTIMGGTVHGRGNTTPAAEFNIYADPEAANIVFAADIETVVVPWEACVAHGMDGPEVDALFAGVPDNSCVAFSKALADRGRHVVKSYSGVDSMRFIDPFAAAIVLDPSIVTKSVTASVAVALAQDITRGMTVVDPSNRLGTPAVTLVEEAKLERLVALYTASLTKLPLNQ